MDAIEMNQDDVSECSIVDEESNAYADMFFLSFERFQRTIMGGFINHNKLSVVAQVFTIKLDQGVSKASYNRIIE